MRPRSLIGIAVFVLVLISSSFFYFSYILGKFGECQNIRLTVIPSPNGSKSVVTYRTECGATVPYSTHASIVSTGDTFSSGSAPVFFSVHGTQGILAAWSGEQIVRIKLIPGASTVYKRDQNVGDIRIEYE